MKTTIIPAICCLLLTSLPAWSEITQYAVGFGPYVGGGQLSNQAKVRHSSGARATLEGRYWTYGNFNAGPRVEIGNGIVNAKKTTDSGKLLSTYDNRFVTAGLRGGYAFTRGKSSDEVYLAACGGWAQSKLSQDQNDNDTYVQQDYKKIQGRYATAELGANMQIRERFSVNVALLTSLYLANQTGTDASLSGDREEANARIALTDNELSDYDQLDDRIVQKTYAASIGLSFGF